MNKNEDFAQRGNCSCHDWDEGVGCLGAVWCRGEYGELLAQSSVLSIICFELLLCPNFWVSIISSSLESIAMDFM